MHCLSKIINLFCSNSVPKLTPGMTLITTSIFYQFQPNPMILFYFKSKNHVFFLLTHTEHFPLLWKDIKNFDDFFEISGWSITPTIWLDKRLWRDNLWTRNVSCEMCVVKLLLSGRLWTHVYFFTYLGMLDHLLMRNIRLGVFLFWQSVQIQTIHEINWFHIETYLNK